MTVLTKNDSTYMFVGHYLNTLVLGNSSSVVTKQKEALFTGSVPEEQ